MIIFLELPIFHFESMFVNAIHYVHLLKVLRRVRATDSIVFIPVFSSISPTTSIICSRKLTHICSASHNHTFL